MSEQLPGRWVWPVATYNGRAPVISDGFDSPRPGLPLHGGVDVMFRRVPNDPWEAGTPNASRLFVMPDNQPVIAASDGVVWSARATEKGYSVVIDHRPRKVATYYAHLDKMFVEPTTRGQGGQNVRAGEIIGTVGFNPLDGEQLKHLHFEVWLGGPSDRIDPSTIMKSWEVLQTSPTRGAPKTRGAPDPREEATGRGGISLPVVIGAGLGLIALGFLIAGAGSDDEVA